MIIENIFSNLGFKRVPSFSESKSNVATSFGTWGSNEQNQIPSSLVNHYRHGYVGNSIVSSCLQRKSETASFANVKLFQGKKEDFEELSSDHPFVKLFENPNENFSWVEFQQLMSLYLDLDGNVYIYKFKQSINSNTVDALYLLRPDKVIPVIKENGFQKELLGYLYKFDENKKPESFLSEEIIHIKYPNPFDGNDGLGRGLSPLNAVLNIVLLDNQNTSFLNTFFKNAAVPFGLLTSKQRINDAEIARLREKIKAQYAGSLNWHEIMILDSDASYQRLGLDLKELEFSALDFRNEARICSQLGVPPQIIGARVGLEHSTYSNYEEARKSFWEDNLFPFYKRFESALNKGFYLEFGGNVWLQYDFSDVPALKSQQESIFQRAIQGLQSGLLKINEARELVGYEPLEESEIEENTSQEETEDEKEVEEEVKTLYKANTFLIEETKAKRIILNTDSNDEARDEIEIKHTALIATALRRQLRIILEEIPNQNATQADLERALSKVQNKETKQILFDAIQKMLIESVLFGARFGLDVIEEFLGINQKSKFKDLKNFEVGTWDLINEFALTWANDYSYDLVTGLTSTSESVIRKSVTTWINNGLPKTDLIASLQSTFGVRRAKMIAVTEVTRAYAKGNVIAYRESGVVDGVIWKTSNDERVCPICGPLGENVISKLEEIEFIHPGGNGARNKYKNEVYSEPPAHVQCRCWISPWVE